VARSRGSSNPVVYFVERRSEWAIHRMTAVRRDTITRALGRHVPTKYRGRAPRTYVAISSGGPVGCVNSIGARF
jgi:hypothetical protein